MTLKLCFLGHERPSNTSNTFVHLVVLQMLRCKLRLFVARITYYLCVQQIFMLQKVETMSTFCNMKICYAGKWYYAQQTIATCNATFVAREVARKCCPSYWALKAEHLNTGKSFCATLRATMLLCKLRLFVMLTVPPPCSTSNGKKATSTSETCMKICCARKW